jgi:hypothetical protein
VTTAAPTTPPGSGGPTRTTTAPQVGIGTWQRLPVAPLPGQSSGYAGAWTSSELLITGPHFTSAAGVPKGGSVGAAYKPTTRTGVRFRQLRARCRASRAATRPSGPGASCWAGGWGSTRPTTRRPTAGGPVRVGQRPVGHGLDRPAGARLGRRLLRRELRGRRGVHAGDRLLAAGPQEPARRAPHHRRVDRQGAGGGRRPGGRADLRRRRRLQPHHPHLAAPAADAGATHRRDRDLDRHRGAGGRRPPWRDPHRRAVRRRGRLQPGDQPLAAAAQHGRRPPRPHGRVDRQAAARVGRVDGPVRHIRGPAARARLRPVEQPLVGPADAPLRGRAGHLAAWTGSQMLVWGGVPARETDPTRPSPTAPPTRRPISEPAP